MERLKQRIFDELNLKRQAEELGLKVWQTPSFLFIVMGIVIIIAMSAVEVISSYYDSPEVLVISESSVVIILFTIGNFIIKIVEEIAKANKMKTEFVSIASHQLKTPLAEMNWQIELLISKYSAGLNQRQQGLIKGIANSSERMGRLVNDLLDVARIDQGQLALNRENVNIGLLVQDVVNSQSQYAKSNNVDLRSSLPVEKIEIVVDKRRFSIALENLISNGIKYTNAGGLVEVFLQENAGKAEICVRDNGIGISKSEQVKIAQKFFRSKTALKGKVDGTGLGLYIAKNFIEQSGGAFWFKSEENVGSEFYFTIPILNNIVK